MHNLTHTTARILTGISLLLLLYAAPATAQVDDTAKRFHIFPQVADGGGWGSVLMAINTSSSETQCDFTLFGDLDFDRFQRYSETSYSGDSKATFSMLGNGGSYLWPSRNVEALATGYAKLDCSAPVTAQIVYLSLDSRGEATGAAAVFSSQMGTVFNFRSLWPPGGLGVAVANDSSSTAYCRFVMLFPDDELEIDAMLEIGAKSNEAHFISNIFGDKMPAEITGPSSVGILCDQLVAVIGLHFFDGPVFTTVPPTILDRTPREVEPTTPPPPPPLPPPITGFQPASRATMESFLGTWKFTHTNRTQITNTFTFIVVIEEPDSNPRRWAIAGTDQDARVAGIIYNPDGKSYFLGVGNPVAGVYIFNYNPALEQLNIGTFGVNVTGCYYDVIGPERLSECYPMTGIRK